MEECCFPIRGCVDAGLIPFFDFSTSNPSFPFVSSFLVSHIHSFTMRSSTMVSAALALLGSVQSVPLTKRASLTQVQDYGDSTNTGTKM